MQPSLPMSNTNNHTRHRPLWLPLLLVYGVGLCYLWFFLPGRLTPRETQRSVHIIPFESTTASLSRALYAPRHRGYYQRSFLRNVAGNLLLLLPLGLLLPSLRRDFRRFWPLLGSALSVSFAAECIQWLFNLGHFDVDDLLLNALGAGLGWWCWRVIAKRKALQ